MWLWFYLIIRLNLQNTKKKGGGDFDVQRAVQTLARNVKYNKNVNSMVYLSFSVY